MSRSQVDSRDCEVLQTTVRFEEEEQGLTQENAKYYRQMYGEEEEEQCNTDGNARFDLTRTNSQLK